MAPGKSSLPFVNPGRLDNFGEQNLEPLRRISVELTKGTSRERGLQVVSQAVDTIETFPDQAEEPTVRLRTERRDVLEVRLFGGRVKIVEPGGVNTDFSGRSFVFTNDETLAQFII